MCTAKLKGFNYPLTPKGKSTLNPPPPWYYSSDFLDVEFWAQPAAVASLLPNGLEPDPAANGHGNALSSTTGSSAELTKNTLIRRVITIASSSSSWTHCSKAGQYRTAPTFSSIMMLRWRVAGLKVIRSVSGKYFRRGITLRQARQVRLSHQDRS